MDKGIEIWVNDVSGTDRRLNLPFDGPFFMGWRTVEPPCRPFTMSGVDYSRAEKMTWVQDTKLGEKMGMAAMQVSTFAYDDDGNFDKRIADAQIAEIFEVPIQQVMIEGSLATKMVIEIWASLTEDFYSRKA